MDTVQIIRGDTTQFELTFRDKDGVLIDLSGSTVFFTVKRRINDLDVNAVIAKEISVFDDPEEGVAIVELSPEDTDIRRGSYIYDVQLVEGDGTITSSYVGKFLCAQDVTLRIDD